jgi:hypothetical protein
MPPLAKKKTKDKPIPAAPEREERKVIYDKITVSGAAIDPAKCWITVAQAMKMLGWEDEPAYVARMIAEGKTEAEAKADFDLAFKSSATAFLDQSTPRRKVICWNSTTNRPFEEPRALQYCQDILNREWQFNLETIILGETGITEQGNHRLIGLVLAGQRWQQNKHWNNDVWQEEPRIQSLIARGASEDPKVILSLDNVKPRSEADSIFTSPIFAHHDVGPRKLLSKMLANARDLLWKRTQARKDSFMCMQTHTATADFIARHPKLIEATEHLYKQNLGYVFSRTLKVYPGQAAAMMYLMAAANTDTDRTDYATKRQEAECDMGLWEKAKTFFTTLAMTQEAELRPVRQALSRIVDVADDGVLHRMTEKLAILALAWNAWHANGKVKDSDLELRYDEAMTTLLDPYSIGGIDFGIDLSPPKNPEEEDTEEDKEAQKVEQRRIKAEETKKKADAAKASKNGKPDPLASGNPASIIAAKVAELKSAHPNTILLFKSGDEVKAWEGDCTAVCNLCDLKPVKRPDKVRVVTFPAKQLDAVQDKLLKAGHRVGVQWADHAGEPVKVTEPAKKKPLPPPKKKQPAITTA